jgi:flagellar basal-body rod modification protein FlgD
VDPGDLPVPSAAVLDASPNPFNQTTRIRLGLAQTGDAVLRVYDSSGRAVRTLTTGAGPAGERFVTWDGRDAKAGRVSSGIYFIRLDGAPEADAVRVTVLR